MCAFYTKSCLGNKEKLHDGIDIELSPGILKRQLVNSGGRMFQARGKVRGKEMIMEMQGQKIWKGVRLV